MVRFLINRPVSVTMSVLAFVIMGLVVSTRLPVSMMPPVDIPEILIKAEYPDYTAVEMERNISRVLVLQLQTVNRLESVESAARDGVCQIRLRFAQAADVDYALIDVYQKIDNATTFLPVDMDYPQIVKARPTDLPVFYLNVLKKEEAKNQSFLETSTLVRTVIREKISQLEPVAMIEMSGFAQPRIMLRVYKDKLQSLGISMDDIEQLLENNNNARGTIRVRQGFYEYDMSFAGSLEDIKDIEELVLLHDGNIFTLKDLAQVSMEARPRMGISLFNRRECISLGIIKRDEARMEDLRDQVELRIAELEKEFPSLQFELSQDQTSLLSYSIRNLRQSLYLGILLALLIMFLFIRDNRTPWLMVVSLPLSLIVAVFFFYISGLTINIISLSGLLLGVGMMIDNSIIVLDNIAQREERGETLSEACVRGTNEIITPLLSSVLTTCSIFIPLIFISGIAGTLFFDQAVAVSIGLFISYFVSILVLPVYYRLLHKGRRTQYMQTQETKHDGEQEAKRRQSSIFERIALFSTIEKHYESWLSWFFRHQWVIALFLLVLLLGGALSWKMLDRSLLPRISQTETVARIDWGLPIPLEENLERSRAFLEAMDSMIVSSSALLGADNYLLSREEARDASQVLIQLECKTENDLRNLIRMARSWLVKRHPSALFEFAPPRNILQDVFGRQEAPLTARLRLDDYSDEEQNIEKLSRIQTRLQAAFPNQRLTAPALKKRFLLSLREDRLLAYGIPKEEVRKTIRIALQHQTSFDLTSFSVTYPVVLGSELLNFRELLHKTMLYHQGDNNEELILPLSDLVELKEGTTMKELRSDQIGRYFPFDFEITAAEKTESEALIREVVAGIPGARVDFSGSIEQSEKQNKEILIIIGISILLLYFILAAQFNSVSQPFIVLLELPIDIGAALLTLLLFGQTINVMALIGIVVMCGIVINDSIIKIDTINRLRKEGYSIIHALLTAGVRRLKPILMTSMTTILSLLPFLLFGGMGNEMQRPLAMALSGGLLFGTFISLFFIPLNYYHLYKKRKTIRHA